MQGEEIIDGGPDMGLLEEVVFRDWWLSSLDLVVVDDCQKLFSCTATELGLSHRSRPSRGTLVNVCLFSIYCWKKYVDENAVGKFLSREIS